MIRIFSFVLFFSLVQLTLSLCTQSKDSTEYAEKLVNILKPLEENFVRLPRRLLGDVYLRKGYINGLNTMRLTSVPTYLICYNDTIGAIQPKIIADNVTFVYEWVYGDDESWGIATIPAQTIYIDIDIEQNGNTHKPTMLGLYITKITKTMFNVVVKGNKSAQDTSDHEQQVSLVSRTFISRDASVALSSDISPKVTDFLFYHRLKMS